MLFKRLLVFIYLSFFFFQAEDGIRDYKVTGVQTCALPISRAPDGQRLPEVLAALLDLPVLRGVEQPADAEGAVDEEPRDFAPGATPLALEQAVGRTLDEPDVVEAVRDQHLKGLRHDLVIDLRGRLQEVAVESPVELEHPLVERLPGIVLLIELLAVRGRLPGGPLRLRHDRRRPLGAVGADALLPIRWEPAPVGGDRGLIDDASGAGEGPAPSEEQHENGERQEGCPAARVDDRDPRQTNPPVAPRMEFEKPATLYPGMPGVVLRIWTRVASPDSRFLCGHAE